MSYTYIRREQTLEELGACVISQAAAFADDCARHGPIPRGLMRRSFSHMLERLERGDVLDERDDACIAMVGKDLVSAANARCAGYGNKVLEMDTEEDVLIDSELERLRLQILAWSQFQFLRNRLRARVKARALIGRCD